MCYYFVSLPNLTRKTPVVVVVADVDETMMNLSVHSKVELVGMKLPDRLTMTMLDKMMPIYEHCLTLVAY